MTRDSGSPPEGARLAQQGSTGGEAPGKSPVTAEGGQSPEQLLIYKLREIHHDITTNDRGECGMMAAIREAADALERLTTQLAERERMLAEADAVIAHAEHRGLFDGVWMRGDAEFAGRNEGIEIFQLRAAALARHRERQNG